MLIFKCDVQIYSCCHVGGGMGWDSEGNLYIATGDNNSSRGSDGYSGNNPVAELHDWDRTTSRRAPTAAPRTYSFPDARRTAGDTNDHNGKMLRFRPLPDIPDGEAPGGRGREHTRSRRNLLTGRTCSSGTEGDGNKTKPEIYAMGLRNPARLRSTR